MISPSVKSIFKKIFLLFLIWRIYQFVVAYFALFLLPNFGNRFPYIGDLTSSGLPYWIWSFGNFDGVYYIRIVQKGYLDQFTQAFFPLYPILIKIVSFITFGNYVLSGLLISNTAFLVGLLLFFKMVTKIYDRKIALWACLFLLSFPTSFYFGSVYTEGLFFLMVISAFYLSSLGKIWQASIIGAFASATRLVGILLAVSLEQTKKAIIPLVVVPIGLLLYIFYLKMEFDKPFYFLSAQSVWGQERSITQIILLPQVFFRYIKILMSVSGLSFFNALLELTSTIFVIVVLILSIGKIKKEWLIFSVLAVLVPTLTGTLTSMPRYILIAFPIYIYLALINNIKAKTLIVIAFMVMQFILTVLFTRGYWVA